MLEKFFRSHVSRTLLSGMAAFYLSACSTGKEFSFDAAKLSKGSGRSQENKDILEDIDSEDSRDSMESIQITQYVDITSAPKDMSEELAREVYGTEDVKGSEEAEIGVKLEVEPKEREREPLMEIISTEKENKPREAQNSSECTDSSPCLCSSIKTISSSKKYALPVVDDYTIAVIDENQEVTFFDAPSEEMTSLAPLKGKKMRLTGHYLSGTYNENTSPEDCQIYDLVADKILYEGLCPHDIDKTLYVTFNPAGKITIGDIIFDEDWASMTSSLKIAEIALGYKEETAAFSGTETEGGKSTIYLWKYVDEIFFFLPKPAEAEDRHPLLEENLLLFSRYIEPKTVDGTTVVKLMKYDFFFDDIFELLSEEVSRTARGEFNGRTLASLMENNKLEAYNLCTGEKAVVDIAVDGNTPSIDANYLVWTKNGALKYCELKEGWKQLKEK